MTTDEEIDNWLAEADKSFVQSVNADVDHAAVLHAVQRAAGCCRSWGVTPGRVGSARVSLTSIVVNAITPIVLSWFS